MRRYGSLININPSGQTQTLNQSGHGVAGEKLFFSIVTTENPIFPRPTTSLPPPPLIE